MSECLCACCGHRLPVIVVVDPTGYCLTVEGFAATPDPHDPPGHGRNAPHCPQCNGTTFVLSTVKR